MNRSLPIPTDSELAILKVVWRKGKATVKEIQEELGPDTGYTTVLKLLQIMREKGLVRSNESERAFVFSAVVTEEQTQQKMLSNLVKKAFAGSKSQLVMRILRSGKTPPSEIAEIRRLIRETDKS